MDRKKGSEVYLGGSLGRASKYNAYSAEQFENPLVSCNLETGECSNRLSSFWQDEERRSSEALLKNEALPGDYELARHSILNKGMDQEDVAILNALRGMAKNGMAPLTQETQETRKLYSRAAKRKGWAWYVAKANLRMEYYQKAAWTKDEEQELESMYKVYTTEELAEYFMRTKNAINSKARKMGLRK